MYKRKTRLNSSVRNKSSFYCLSLSLRLSSYTLKTVHNIDIKKKSGFMVGNWLGVFWGNLHRITCGQTLGLDGREAANSMKEKV